MSRTYKLSFTTNYPDGTEAIEGPGEEYGIDDLEDAIDNILTDKLASSFVFTIVVIP